MDLGVVWCGRHSAQMDLGVVWCGSQFGAAGTVLRLSLGRQAQFGAAGIK